MNEITKILSALDSGQRQASEELLPLIYEQLRILARSRMAAERDDHTLQATDLVHEAYLRLVNGDKFSWKSRGHFFGAAAEAMRRILVEHARRKKTVKRGGDFRRAGLSAVAEIEEPSTEEDRILGINAALDELQKVSARRAELVKLRFFGGLTIEEAARMLDISMATAKRDWVAAKIFVFQRLSS